MPNWLRIVLVLYAVLLAAGGLFGYFKAGSQISLIASLSAAAVLLFALWYSSVNRTVGLGLCALVVVALIAFFGVRVAGGSTMPGIPGLAMSIAALACLAYAHFTAK